MRFFAQAAEIPEIFDTPAQLPDWAIALVGGIALFGVAAFLIYRHRRLSHKRQSSSRLSAEA